MPSTTKNKGPARRKPRVHSRCKVCERPVLEFDPLGIDVGGRQLRAGQVHHVEICANCVSAITAAGIRRNLLAIWPGLEDL